MLYLFGQTTIAKSKGITSRICLGERTSIHGERRNVHEAPGIHEAIKESGCTTIPADVILGEGQRSIGFLILVMAALFSLI